MANKAFNINAALHIQGPYNLKEVSTKLKREFAGISANIDVRLNPNTAGNIQKTSKEIRTLLATLKQVEPVAKSVAASITAIGAAQNKVSAQTDKLAGSQRKLSGEVRGAAKNVQRAKNEMEEFGRISGLAVRRFAGFTIATTTILSLTGAIGSATKESIDFQREVVRIAQATDTSVKGVKSLTDEVGRLSKEFGVSSMELLGAARILAQAGLSVSETRIAMEALAKTDVSPSFNSIEETTEGAIAAMRQFNISARELESVLGSINQVSAAYAVESEDIIQAIRRTGGVFAAAAGDTYTGVEALQQFIAIFTSVRQTTRESSESIATGLRTIFTRLQRKETLESLDAMGVELLDLEGKFIGLFPAIEQLSKALQRIDTRDPLFSQITEELGGFRQIGKTIPLIKQNAVAQRAYQEAIRGTNSLDGDAVESKKALALQFEKTRQKFLEFIRELTETTFFQNVVGGVLTFADSLISLANALKPVIPLLAALAAFKGIQSVLQFGRGFTTGLVSNGGAAGLGKRAGGGATVTSTQNVSALSANTKALHGLTQAILKLSVGSAATPFAPRRRASGGGIYSPRRRFAAGGGTGIRRDPFRRSSSVAFSGGRSVGLGKNAKQNSLNIPNDFGAVFLRSPTGRVADIHQTTSGVAKFINPITNKEGTFNYDLTAASPTQAASSGLQKGITRGIADTVSQQAERLGKFFGISSRTKIDGSFLKSINIDNITGNVFEGILSRLGAQFGGARQSNSTFDYPFGIGGDLAGKFGINGGIPTDAKGTFNTGALKSVNKKVGNYVKAFLGDEQVAKIRANVDPNKPLNKRQVAELLNRKSEVPTAEILRRFGADNVTVLPSGSRDAAGKRLTGDHYLIKKIQELKSKGGELSGLVPALTEPGEVVFGPQAASQAGYSALAQFNATGDASGLRAFDSRDVYRVPGSGRGDSYASDIPEGSFVIRRDFAEDFDAATRKLPKRFAGGGAVQRFARGSKKPVGGGSVNINSGSYLSEEAIESLLEQLEKDEKYFMLLGQSTKALADEQNKYRDWYEKERRKKLRAEVKAGPPKEGNLIPFDQKDKLEEFVYTRAKRKDDAQFEADANAEAASREAMYRANNKPIGIEPALIRPDRGDATLDNFLNQRRDRQIERAFKTVSSPDLSIKGLPVGFEAAKPQALDTTFAETIKKQARMEFAAESKARHNMIRAFEQYGHSTYAAEKAMNAYMDAIHAGKGRLVALNNAMDVAAKETKALGRGVLPPGYAGPPLPPGMGPPGRSRFSRAADFARSGFGRASNFATGRGMSPEQIDRRNTGVAFGGFAASMIAGSINATVAPKDPTNAAIGGGATGALTGFAVGASIAPMAGPFAPLVIAATTAGGALLGAATAFEEAADALDRNKLVASADKLSLALEKMEKGLISAEEAHRVYQDGLKDVTAANERQKYGINSFLAEFDTINVTDDLLAGLGFADGKTDAQKRIRAITAEDDEVGGLSLFMANFGDRFGYDTLKESEETALRNKAQENVENARPFVDGFKKALDQAVRDTGSYEGGLEKLNLTRSQVNQTLGMTDVDAQYSALQARDPAQAKAILELAGKQTGNEQITKDQLEVDRITKELNETYKTSVKNVDLLAIQLRDMTQAIAEASNAGQGFRSLIADVASGFGNVSASQLQDVSNYRALSPEEISKRFDAVRQVAGDTPGLAQAENLIQQSKEFEGVALNVLRDAISKENIAGTGPAAFQRTIEKLQKSDTLGKFDPRLIDALKTAVSKAGSDRDAKVSDFGKTLDDPNFIQGIISGVVQEASSSFSAAVNHTNTTLTQFSDALNLSVQKQLQASDLQDSIVATQNSILNRANELRGGQTSFDTLRQQRMAPIIAASSRAGLGGTTDVGSITTAILRLRNERAGIGTVDNQEEGIRLAENTRKLAEATKALGLLAGEVSELSAIEQEISNAERRKEAGTDLAKRFALAGSDPGELRKLALAQMAGQVARSNTAVVTNAEGFEALDDWANIAKGRAKTEQEIANIEELRQRTIRRSGGFAVGVGARGAEDMFGATGAEADKQAAINRYVTASQAQLEAIKAQTDLASTEIRAVGGAAIGIIQSMGGALGVATTVPFKPGGFLSGGFIDGPYRGHRDSEIIAAQPGEFIVNRRAAQANAGLLSRMNAGYKVNVPGFVGGGSVGRSGGRGVEMGLSGPSIQALNSFASSSAQLSAALGQLGNLSQVANTLNSALTSLANINIPSRIEVAHAPLQVTVIHNGAEMFHGMEESLGSLVDQKIGDAIKRVVNPVTGETREGGGRKIVGGNR